MKSVDEALNIILSADIEFDMKHHRGIEDCYLIPIQKLARVMHCHYWKYRKKILDKIHEWVENHPSEWKDANGRIWKIGYGEQMHPFYGCFEKEYDILELWRQR